MGEVVISLNIFKQQLTLVINMELEICGNGNEIGRSAFLLKGDKNLMLDYGVKLHPEPPSYPILPSDRIDAVLLSHAHLDHSGAIPALYNKRNIHSIMTDVTLDLTTLLLIDSLNISKKEGYDIPFTMHEIKLMKKNTFPIKYENVLKIGDFDCRFYDAGHIPGSAGIFIESGKSVFYTGDVQTTDSHLLNGCRLPKKADVVITESTYGYKDHSKREDEEKRFLDSVEETIANEENVLIPAFAVGRAQEILLMLEDYADKIVLDGMAKKASEIIDQYRYHKDVKKLKNILRRVKWVHSRQERSNILKKRPIAVSSAGMLAGGPAVHYLREIRKQEESKVMFVGFQVEDSPGAKLIKSGIFDNGEERFNVKCKLEQYQFSSHTDRNGLKEIIQKLNPKTVIAIHGDKTKKFAEYIEKETGVQALAPQNGDVIKL